MNQLYTYFVRLEWYRSATVGLFTQSGTSILCDPWITDGAFIGSWFHWPPLQGFEFDYLVNRNWDAVYISHFHADHFDRKLVASIARSSPITRVLIPNYANKWLKRAVINCGFEPNRVLELENNVKFSFKDFDITMFVADYCNPQICGVQIPCLPKPAKQTSNDSLALFVGDGFRVLNANDALAVQSAHKLWPVIGEVDLLLGHYGGAGPYPQCFPDLSDSDKLLRAEDLGWRFVDRLVETAIHLKAKLVMPYAGQYVLGGRLASLNPYRSVIPISQVIDRIRSSNTLTPLTLEAFSSVELKNHELHSSWREPTSTEHSNYLDRISKKTYPYEGVEEEWPNSTKQLVSALGNVANEFNALIEAGGEGSRSSITISSTSASATINFDQSRAILTFDGPLFENHTEIICDSRLLRRLISRRPNYKGFTQYHFNQADIGSHLQWRRTGSYPRETDLLNFMQSDV